MGQKQFIETKERGKCVLTMTSYADANHFAGRSFQVQEKKEILILDSKLVLFLIFVRKILNFTSNIIFNSNGFKKIFFSLLKLICPENEIEA